MRGGSMLALKKRLGASILLTVLSIVTIVLLLPNSRVTTHLSKIPELGKTIWQWEGEDQEVVLGGMRLVVFGDSWVDNKIEEGKGKSWTDILCAELNCSSHLNFAETQSSSAYPSDPPSGTVTSNEIHEKASLQFTSIKRPNLTLPDLATQIQSFIALPPSSDTSGETVFVISFGFWDIYHLAGLDYNISTNLTDTSVEELFTQLDILYTHFKYNLTQTPVLESLNTTKIPEKFRVILSKLFDPTLLPGWQAQRPTPLSPGSVAEQQKNAIYLTNRWNIAVENSIGVWMSTSPSNPEFTVTKQESQEVKVEKDAFYHDLSTYLLDLIIEYSLEAEDLTDETGLSKGKSPFGNVYLPCVSVGEENLEDVEELVEVKGRLVCTDPRGYLWWDGWRLGPVGNEGIGGSIAGRIKEGDSLRSAWKEVGKERA